MPVKREEPLPDLRLGSLDEGVSAFLEALEFERNASAKLPDNTSGGAALAT